MKTQIIKHRLADAILFEFECTTLKECVIAAVKQKKSLQGAYITFQKGTIIKNCQQ